MSMNIMQARAMMETAIGEVQKGMAALVSLAEVHKQATERMARSHLNVESHFENARIGLSTVLGAGIRLEGLEGAVKAIAALVDAQKAAAQAGAAAIAKLDEMRREQRTKAAQVVTGIEQVRG